MHGGVEGGGVAGEFVAVGVVGGGQLGVAALFGGIYLGGELIEQAAVNFGGVFGADPVGVGVGQVVLLGALLVVTAGEVGELVGGGGFGGACAAGKDRVGKFGGVGVGGVALVAQGGDGDVGLGGGGAVAGQVGEVELAAEGVFGEAVGVVVGVGWRLVQVRVGGVGGPGVQVGLLSGLRRGRGVGAFGGVGDVGVDGGGVVGEKFDAVGQQPRVFVGAQVFGLLRCRAGVRRRRPAGRAAAIPTRRRRRPATARRGRR